MGTARWPSTSSSTKGLQATVQLSLGLLASIFNIFFTKLINSLLSSPVRDVKLLSKVVPPLAISFFCSSSPFTASQYRSSAPRISIKTKGFTPSAVKYRDVLSPRLRSSIGGGPSIDIISSNVRPDYKPS